LQLGVLLARRARFSARGGGFLGECREEISKHLQAGD
jgi:hypothetical protein